jgi:copper transporter 1
MSGKVQSSASKEGSTEASRDGPIPTRKRRIPPFVPSHDIPRGVIQAMQSTFSYAFMLAVM